MTRLPRLSLLLCAGLLPAQQTVPTPDPATVQHCGKGYRFPQDGWIVLHIEGEPYERGFQHGNLMAEELAALIRTLGCHRSKGSAEDGWKNERLLCNALFLRSFDAEYLEEMSGIAAGANSAGASIFGRALDAIDVAAVNSSVETMCLEDGLDGLPTGLEGKAFSLPGERKGEHCSAFAATGPATKDGKIVFGHITMFMLPFADFYNVWLDVQPTAGHRILMQTSAGGIWSGLDYYQNDVGILLAETTIGQTRFERNGTTLAARARKAMQYGDSIDAVVKALATNNNGLYTNEWLLGDTKTNEVAMFELGTQKSHLWRSAKNEFPGGTPGFYWGCNNERELDIRLEQVPSVQDRPRDLSFHPSDRDCKWLELYDQWHGKIDIAFAKTAFTTPPLAASHSLDAKFTTSDLAGRLQSIGLFGTPLGPTWMPSAAEQAQYPEITPLVNHDWTLLGPVGVASEESDARDLGLRDAHANEADANHATPPPAWHGTLLPATGADFWLPVAFAAYERIVANQLSREDTDEFFDPSNGRRAARLVARFQMRARWQQAVRSLGKDVPLQSLQPDLRRREWYELALSKGVTLLDNLRERLGDEAFLPLMDAFGRAHAGQIVKVADFVAAVEQAGGKDLDEMVQSYIAGTPSAGPTVWSITAFEQEPEQALIVYGTLKEAPTNHEAALLLQSRVASRWHNFAIPIKADVDVTDAEIQSHHLVLIGRPRTNKVAQQLSSEKHFAFPLQFGTDSFAIDGITYASARTAVVAAGANPRNERFSLVLYAGLSSDCTREVAQCETQDCEVLLFPHGEDAKALSITDLGPDTRDASERKPSRK